MNDLMQDVRDYLTDRFSSPLWLSIIISWLLINWRLPITAIFESDRFNVSYINFYIDSVDHWCLITLPILFGLAYSIFSSSAKETLELSSKVTRSAIVKLDRSGKLYRSISINQHNSEIDRLKRKLQKIEIEKAEIAELSAELLKTQEENNKLGNNNSILKSEIEILNQKKNEFEIINNELKNSRQKLSEIKKINEEYFLKNKELDEQLKNNSSHEHKIQKLESEAQTLEREKNEKANKINLIKSTIESYLKTQKPNEEIIKLILDLENLGITYKNEAQEKSKNEITISENYYKTIIENSNNETKENLKKHNSNETIYLILSISLAIKSYKSETFLKAGVPENIGQKTLPLLLEANYLQNHEKYGIIPTETGFHKLDELTKDARLKDIKNISSLLDKKCEKELLKETKSIHISKDELLKKVYFNPRIDSILGNLVKIGLIKNSGNVYSS